LEELELCFDIDNDNLRPGSAQDIAVVGLLLQGAQYSYGSKGVVFSEDLRYQLSRCKLKWCMKKIDSNKSSEHTFPIYLNESRKQLIGQAILPVGTGITASQWAQRSVAMILQTPHT
jgi:hypothetical protein